MVEMANALEYVADLLVLDFQLRRVSNMLVLAPTALPEITTLRLNAIGGRAHHPQQARTAKSLFDIGDLDFHRFSENHEGNEHHEIVDSRNPFTSEGDVANFNSQLIAFIGTHLGDARGLYD